MGMNSDIYRHFERLAAARPFKRGQLVRRRSDDTLWRVVDDPERGEVYCAELVGEARGNFSPFDLEFTSPLELLAEAAE